MRVLVCGGRDYADDILLAEVLDDIDSQRRVTLLIEGEARGADTLARQWAERRRIPVRKYPADWEHDGKAAGPIRNQRMLDDGKPDLVVAFPGGRGTADMVRRANAAGVRVQSIGHIRVPWAPR
jgi:hypothetical protein